VLTLLGILLLWFGYTLFFGIGGGGGASGSGAGRRGRGRASSVPESFPGAPRTCPVCSARLPEGQRVKSAAFPSMNGNDRLMNISGCVFCLSGERRRSCPVCGSELGLEEVLVARMFEKPGRSHVHVLGCTRCRRPSSRH